MPAWPGVEALALLGGHLSPQLRAISGLIVPGEAVVVEEKSIPERVMGIPMVEPSEAGCVTPRRYRPHFC